MRQIAAALALLPLLAACNEHAKVVAPAQADSRQELAIRAAQERVQARLRIDGESSLRAVVAHRQALGDTVAVCGQVNPTGRREDPFLPWVAVLTFAGEAVARSELHLAATGAEATRVYFEMIERCRDGGGPAVARPTGRPLPPAPDAMPIAIPDLTPPRPAPSLPAQASVAASIAVSAPTGGVTITQRSAANLRAQPSSGSEVLRTLPRGASLTLFGEAPGGWLQVGEAEPWGWVHGSLVER
jgi:hypothetical protein